MFGLKHGNQKMNQAATFLWSVNVKYTNELTGLAPANSVVTEQYANNNLLHSKDVQVSTELHTGVLIDDHLGDTVNLLIIIAVTEQRLTIILTLVFAAI